MFIRPCGELEDHPPHEYDKLWTKSELEGNMPDHYLRLMPGETWTARYKCQGEHRWKDAAQSSDELLRAVMDAMGCRYDQDPVIFARELRQRAVSR